MTLSANNTTILSRLVIGAFVSTLFCLLLAIPANAKQPQVKVRDSAYSARFVSQSEPDPIKIEAGTTKTRNGR